MNRYERPTLLATYSASELEREAAHCTTKYEPLPSDRALKEDIAEITAPVGRLSRIDTR